MAVFMLDTDAVTAGISSLENLYSKLQQISDSVNGYDTSCIDGFDFHSAKSFIASNVETCAEKVKGTYDLINNVVSSHVSLQSSLKFEDFSEKKKIASGGSTGSAGSNSKSSSSSNASIGTNSSLGSGASTSFRTGGGGSSSSGSLGGGASASTFSSGSSAIGGLASAGMAGAAAIGGSVGGLSSGGSSSAVSSGSTSSTTKANISSSTTSKSSSRNSTRNVGGDTSSGIGSKKEVTDNVNKVDYYEFDRTNFSNYKSNISKSFNFREDGFITINNRNAISCDNNVGDVGDIISITTSDGNQFECIVVENTSKNSGINFYVDKTNFNMNKNSNLSEMILNEKTKIVNLGQDSNFQIQYGLQTIDSDIEILN